MNAFAGRSSLFPIGPTTPFAFASGSPERQRIAVALEEIRSANFDVANIIDGQEVRTGQIGRAHV